jgi:hypothetical protein
MYDSDEATRLSVRINDEKWRQASGFAEAGPDDKVFAVDSAGTIMFGDGTHGRRPAAGDAVTVSYRQRSGSAGNVQLSIATSWPPPDHRYIITLASAGLRISSAGEMVERFGGDKRVRYFAGQLLTAADFQDEQQYLIRKRRRHNQALHGRGVVSGLDVRVSLDGSTPAVVVEPGLALDRNGREIELSVPVTLALSKSDYSLYIIAEYAERDTDPVPLPGDTNETTASRVEEGASIRLSTDEDAGDGIAIGRLVVNSTGWSIDRAFDRSRCR